MNSWGWLDTISPEMLNQVEVTAGDIRDPGFVRSAVMGCESVLHLAALIAIPHSYIAPDSYIDTNVRGTLNLLLAARDRGVSRFVHTSTSEVYGTARFVPITEDHPLQAQSPYAASKIASDQLALSFFHSFGLPLIILRPFNTFGPRQSARAVIPTIITQLASGSCELRLGATSPTRDFTFVSDTVTGFVQALDSPNVVGETINLGTGSEFSIGHTATLISELMNIEAIIVPDEDRVRPKGSEVNRLLAGNEKAKSLLSWSPRLVGEDGFRLGLAETVEWFSEAANLARYKWDRYNT
jgi:NAD dependent epimerase/dehydratase